MNLFACPIRPGNSPGICINALQNKRQNEAMYIMANSVSCFLLSKIVELNKYLKKTGNYLCKMKVPFKS